MIRYLGLHVSLLTDLCLRIIVSQVSSEDVYRELSRSSLYCHSIYMGTCPGGSSSYIRRFICTVYGMSSYMWGHGHGTLHAVYPRELFIKK